MFAQHLLYISQVLCILAVLLYHPQPTLLKSQAAQDVTAAQWRGGRSASCLEGLGAGTRLRL